MDPTLRLTPAHSLRESDGDLGRHGRLRWLPKARPPSATFASTAVRIPSNPPSQLVSTSSGLGDRFLAEVKSATRTIEEYPEIAPIVDLGVRAKLLVRFPYSLMYVVDENELFILAVAHQSRRPAYWADRLPSR